MRPSALLCTSLSVVLVFFLFPDTCSAGKKVIPPVKHLFGVGIGYQKVVHYKPVLVISKSRRVKSRPSGWGWAKGKSGGGGGYSPVILKQQNQGKRGYAYGHSAPPHHRRKRKRPHRHQQRAHSHSGGGPGWGWRRGWRRPHRSYRRGHNEENRYSNEMDARNPQQQGIRGYADGENRYSNDMGTHHRHPPHQHRENGDDDEGNRYREMDPRNRHPNNNRDQSNNGARPSYTRRPGPTNPNPMAEMSDYPPSGYRHHEVSDNPPTIHQHYEDGVVWGTRSGGNGNPMFYPSQSSNYYGSPYSSIEDIIDDDHGGYGSEIREEWKTDDLPTTASSIETSTSAFSPSPTPPLFPFPDHLQSDASVTNIHKDFLKTHMKNFHQFQNYQQATTSQPNQNQEENHFTPNLLRPPRPYFSTIDPNSSETEERGNDVNYDDDYMYDEKQSRGNGEENYDDYSNPHEVNRKLMPQPNSQLSTTISPTMVNNDHTNEMNQPSGTNFHPTITTMPNNDKKFKPSPRVDEMGSGNSFNKPGFFPTFHQFQKTKATQN